MTPLYAHQEEGVREAMKLTDPDRGRVAPGCLLLAFEMRLGKTRTTIEAAQRLYLEGTVDQVIVVCPAPVRGVWFDQDLGQITQYSTVPVDVTEYRAKVRTWERGAPAQVCGTCALMKKPRGRSAPLAMANGLCDHECPGYAVDPQASCRWPNETRCGPGCAGPLRWVVTNYEFLRRPERLAPLLKEASARTLLVIDESSYVSSPSAAQTKAVQLLRKKCGRVLLLNGTPEGDNPGDLYSQFKIMDPAILGCRTWYEFRNNYAVTAPMFVGQRSFHRVVSWRNLDELGRRTAPYVLRRAASEVLDMPTALDPVTLTATLTPATWRLYKEMREESVAWLSDNTRATAAQAAVRVLRLAQLTSGYLGGVSNEGEELPISETREVGREKLDILHAWFHERFASDPNFRVVVWCRFRAEAERLARELRGGRASAGLLLGGQREEDRAAALALLDPRVAQGPAVLVGTTKTGGLGLDMSGAATAVYASNDYSLAARRQSAARILGPNQKRTCAYFDVAAEGPEGQKTIDHVILKALRAKRDLGAMTAREWARELL